MQNLPSDFHVRLSSSLHRSDGRLFCITQYENLPLKAYPAAQLCFRSRKRAGRVGFHAPEQQKFYHQHQLCFVAGTDILHCVGFPATVCLKLYHSLRSVSQNKTLSSTDAQRPDVITPLVHATLTDTVMPAEPLTACVHLSARAPLHARVRCLRVEFWRLFLAKSTLRLPGPLKQLSPSIRW